MTSPNAAYAERHAERTQERRRNFGRDGYYTDHVAFAVTSADFDDARGRMREWGIECKEQTVVRPEGEQRQVFFIDVDGYAWEFCECTPAMLADQPT